MTTLTVLTLWSALCAQSPETRLAAPAPPAPPFSRGALVRRTLPAINYRLSKESQVGFRSTPLLAEAEGKAEVEVRKGTLEVALELQNLAPATSFGPGFLTYVLWAITPEGRPTNLGEVFIAAGKGRLRASTALPAFGMIVTAEPHFAVSQPSDLVVLENSVRSDTTGRIETVEAKYELLQKQHYPGQDLAPASSAADLGSRSQHDLAQARRAIAIARLSGADRQAPDVLRKAEGLLADAEARSAGHKGEAGISMSARQAVQTAEDARAIALKRSAEAALAAERREAASSVADAQAQARTEAEAARQAEANAAEAERRHLQAEATTAEAERRHLQAELEKSELRFRLLQQLSVILETRETARGLIVNMSDVLFDFGKDTLRPGAREKLARVGGIVLSHTGLVLTVEGHTDSVGSDDYNLQLSERRAASVRGYLIAQGIVESTIAARGFGESMPVASNETPEGRQQNRRVELVVAGEPIGIEIRSVAVQPR